MFQIRPFAASHLRGTKPPCWRANVAPGQDKQRKLPFKIIYIFCLSSPSAAFALQRGGFVPREWLAAKGLLASLILIHWIEIYPVDNAIHLLNNRVWIPNSNPRTYSGSVYKKRIPGFRNPDCRTPRISITDSILQCGTINQGRKQDMIPWLPR